MSDTMTADEFRNLPKDKYKQHIEFRLVDLIEAKKIRGFEKELVFDSSRKFRFDWAIPDKKIAIEYEGVGVAKGGKSRHTTKIGYATDCEKYNLAVINGWRVLRYTSKNYQQVMNDLTKLL